MAKKWVYLSSSAAEDLKKTLGYEPELAKRKEILGGKGAGLAEMMLAGAPVPPSFTITTEACVEYMKTNEFPEGMWEQTLEALKEIEKQTGKKFGDAENPLLVSVRSGARVSMPGMMDTVLNLGLNETTRAALQKLTNNEWFSYDAYRRFVSMFGDIVKRIRRDENFEPLIEAKKEEEGVKADADITLDGMKDLVKKFKEVYKKELGEDFPTDPMEQLRESIKAVFDSWNGERAVAYRDSEGIPHDWGTAVNVCTMVFGNMGDESGTGVAFTRDPGTGKHEYLYGEFLMNAQGEDVVAGIRTPQKITLAGSREWAESQGISEKERAEKYPSMEEIMPEKYKEFLAIAEKLEQHYKDMQDMEFTVEHGKLWMLQTRTGKRTAAAAINIAVDQAEEGLITKEAAVLRIKPLEVEMQMRPTFDPEAEKTLIAKGLNASPGAAVGKAIFDAGRAKVAAEQNEAVVLVRPETSPDDVPGMMASKGVLTQKGGATSHAAVVARGKNLPCVAGCEDISVDTARRRFTKDNIVVKEGEVISIDGFTGEVFKGAIDLVEAKYEEQADLIKLLSWADEIRSLGVRANADEEEDAAQAVAFGAEGIGLCRTEHMFFDDRARDAVVRMIIAADDAEREAALEEMLPFQEQDFEGVFRAMDGKPVIMRLIDPPMHEFLPNAEVLTEEIYELKLKILMDTVDFEELDDLRAELQEKEEMLRVVRGLWETNPMMGLRGCRAGIMYKGLTEMQTRAYFQAACRCAARGIKVIPEVMIPLVGHVNELKLEREKLEAVAKEVMKEEGVEVEYMFGTMIEVPRAALTAGDVAEYAQFFSFGTNDLTQMTYGYSRDDAEGKFLIQYVDQDILPENPFQSLDQAGVGRLVQMCVEDGKESNPDLEIGICGEHGGDPSSIDFCHRVGLDYVSCSPFRVPVARLAAAQAEIRNPRKK